MNEHTIEIMAREQTADRLREMEQDRLLRTGTVRATRSRHRRPRAGFALVQRLARVAGVA